MDSTDRHIMWRNLIGEKYDYMDGVDKKHARAHYAMNRGKKPGDFHPSYVELPNEVPEYPISKSISFATLPIPTHTEWGTKQPWMVVLEQKKEETTMENLIQDTKRHLSRRVEQVRYNKRRDFYKTFYIYDNACPDTIEEALERIAKEQYTVAPKNEDYDFSEWTHRLHWRDPAHPADQAGFDAANERMNTAFQRAFDDIQVLTSEEGLKALREFEDTDFSK